MKTISTYVSGYFTRGKIEDMSLGKCVGYGGGHDGTFRIFLLITVFWIYFFGSISRGKGVKG